MRVIDKGIPILITGETGSGKEAFAGAIHANSDRACAPFVAVNSASIPESLIEGELFGYRSGSFTGANKQGMKGKIELANGGTLFLDEIGDMPVLLQTRLLRVLAEKEVMPIGAHEPVHLDINIISLTHQNIMELVQSNHFREDLYYRLNGMSLLLPALRERTDREYIIRLINPNPV
jgi:transcriptional regulator with PAS, ATPase and Fis domain